MKKNRLLTIISALAVLAGGVGTMHAQNKVTNGTFRANAAAFTVSPGGVGNTDGSATNPPIASWSTYPAEDGKGLNGAGTPLGNIFGPADPGGRTFAFVQNGSNAIYQVLSLAPNTSYLLSIDIAGRNGDAAPTFAVKMGDGLPAFWNSGDIAANQDAFTHYSYIFTTPATFASAPIIQLWNVSPAGDNSVVFANVSVVPASQMIVNGDFMENAPAYVVWPGYNQDGAVGFNPASITYWAGAINNGGKGVNGAAVGFAGSPFGPNSAGGRTYAFIQGAGALTQDLPITYAPGKVYQLNFDAAARGGNLGVTFRVQIGDASQEHFTTQVGGVELVGNPDAFTSYIYIFTPPATFDGAPSIQLSHIYTSGDKTIDFANVSLQVATNAVLITQQPTPTALTRFIGGTATFTAAAIGTNTVSYRWRHAGTNLTDGGKFSGTTTTSLVISSLTTAEAGSYNVVASVGPNSATSQAATLTVYPVIFISQPKSQTLYSGRTASFTVAVGGSGTISYQWRKNGSNLSDGGKFSGTTTTNLVISNVTGAEVASYDVVVTVGADSVPSQSATLAVAPAPAPGDYAAKILSYNPMGYWRFSDGGGTNAYDYIGSVLAVDPLGQPLQAGPQPLTYGGFESANSAPFLNGTNQGFASTSQMFNGMSNFTLMGWFKIDMSQYPFTNPDGRASLFGQEYAAEISLYKGPFADTQLYFFSMGIAATIFVPGGFADGAWHFVAAVSDQAASMTTVYLDGVAAGTGTACPGTTQPYFFSIGKNVSNFPDIPSFFPGSIDEVAAFDHALSASEVQGLYLAATPAIFFSSQPQSHTLYAGRTASFTAVAEVSDGTGTISYRWRKNGSNLSDGGKFSGTTTTNLVISNVAAGEAGTYDVVATVGVNSVTSQAATLGVVLAPVAGSYAAKVVSYNPMGYWRFSDGGGTNAYDYIAGNDGVDPLGQPLQAGPQPPTYPDFDGFNTASLLDGLNQGYASTSQMFNGLSNFTLMGWFKIDPSQYPFTNNPAGRASLFGQLWTAELGFYGGTNMYFYSQGIDAVNFVTNGFAPGIWHFAAVVSDHVAGKTTIYLDGVVVETSGACPGVTLPYFFSIGKNVSNFPDVPSFFPGSIDEVAAFDHALSAADVQSLYKVAAPVALKIGWSGANQLTVTWPQGMLLQADAVTGPWTTNSASSPYLFAPSAAKRFYRVKVQ